MSPLAVVGIAFVVCPLGLVSLVAWEARAWKRERREAEELLAAAFMDNATVEAVRQAIERERQVEIALEHYRAQVAEIATWQ